MKTSIPGIARSLLAPLILAAVLLLALSGIVTDLTGKVSAPLSRRNQAYLDASIKDTAHLMIPVGAAKAAADAVEGSTVDIEAGAVFAKAGMSIEAGDILQPLLDCIEVAWNLLLLSMVYLLTAKCILAGANALAAPLLVVSVCAFLLNSLIALRFGREHAVRQTLQRLGSLFLLCALLFLLIIPLTVTGSAYLSRHTTDPMREEVQASFTRISKVFSMERFHAAEELTEKAIVLKDKLIELGRYSKESLSDVAISVCKLAAIKLLNGIVFPLASFAFLIWLVRGCLCPALGLCDRPLAQNDLRHLGDYLRSPRPPDGAPARQVPAEVPETATALGRNDA